MQERIYSYLAFKEIKSISDFKKKKDILMCVFFYSIAIAESGRWLLKE